MRFGETAADLRTYRLTPCVHYCTTYIQNNNNIIDYTPNNALAFSPQPVIVEVMVNILPVNQNIIDHAYTYYNYYLQHPLHHKYPTCIVQTLLRSFNGIIISAVGVIVLNLNEINTSSRLYN